VIIVACKRFQCKKTDIEPVFFSLLSAFTGAFGKAQEGQDPIRLELIQAKDRDMMRPHGQQGLDCGPKTQMIRKGIHHKDQ
jgi:hypothetical protein